MSELVGTNTNESLMLGLPFADKPDGWGRRLDRKLLVWYFDKTGRYQAGFVQGSST